MWQKLFVDGQKPKKVDAHGHVHKYEAVFGSFVDNGIVVTFLSFT